MSADTNPRTYNQDHWQDMNDAIQRFTTARVQVLEERIAKAREILTHSMSESREYLLIQIGKALEALEGK